MSTKEKYFNTLLSVSFISLFCPSLLFAQNTPDDPVIIDPYFDGQIVNPSDVHMETQVMTSSNPEMTHTCSDWEIRKASDDELVWSIYCIGSTEKIHIHLGDGNFSGSHAGRSALFYTTSYILKVRFKNNSDEWSNYSTRTFTTGPSSEIFPVKLIDIITNPTPTLKTESGLNVILPNSGSVKPFIKVSTNDNELLLKIIGNNSVSNTFSNPVALAEHHTIKVVISGGSTGLVLQKSILNFTNDSGKLMSIYFPSLNIQPNEIIYLWVASNGSTYYGTVSQTDPDFSTLAQGSAVPWEILQDGYKVEIFASGFQLPVNIIFAQHADSAEQNDPYFYVSELYGTIKLVTKNGQVSDYATNLLNFNPTGSFPGSGEKGLSGIAIDPVSGDIFACLVYDANPPNNVHYPKIIRIHSDDGGKTAATISTVLTMPGEAQSASHFISTITIGKDQKLYVHIGDGFLSSTALNFNSFRGKILRINMDGTAPTDNPFYNFSDGINSKDYIYAYGFRNPFGGTWRASDSSLYAVENGPSRNDRFSKITRGGNYGWNGTDASMTTNAIYNWFIPRAPVNLAFIQQESFNGSSFPTEKMDHAFITLSGPTWATGEQANGKRIVEVELDNDNKIIGEPKTFLNYIGIGKATAAAISSRPDGLYFSDLYKDNDYTSAIDRGANILRIQFIGKADFSVDINSGSIPLTVNFTDKSITENITSWNWNFGDGTTSTAQNPSHTYTNEGIYTINLSVTGKNGLIVKQRSDFITVGALEKGIKGEYFNNTSLSGFPDLVRIDSMINFNWSLFGSPDPEIKADTFSVRWTGRIKADYSELYTFYPRTDDGVRLWIDDELIVERWFDQSGENLGTKFLEAGVLYKFVMEYYEDNSYANSWISWSSLSTPYQKIPASKYFQFQTQSLPVEITKFETMLIDPNSVLITWKTVSETNNSGFEIQKSYDMKNFEGITFIHSNGTTNQSRNYQYIDHETRFPVYFRLKQLDLDGKSSYSPIVLTGKEIIKNFELSQNYPNPFNPKTIIDYTIAKESDVTIKVFNTLGQQVKTLLKEKNVIPGKYSIQFDGSELTSGLYVYKIETGNFTQVRKMLLLK